jgi:hypothetical protein
MACFGVETVPRYSGETSAREDGNLAPHREYRGYGKPNYSVRGILDTIVPASVYSLTTRIMSR